MAKVCVWPLEEDVSRDIPPDGGVSISDLEMVTVCEWLESVEDVKVFESPLGVEGELLLEQREAKKEARPTPIPQRLVFKNSFRVIFLLS